MSNPTKIFIVEDDNDIATLLDYNFLQEKWEVQRVSEGKQALQKIKEFLPQVVILDLMLPDASGLDICRALKTNESTKNIPVIMLTAKSEEIDRIVGFEIGADDYVTKPFSPRELILRIKSILKRDSEKVVKKNKSDPIVFGELVLDKERHEVQVTGVALQLTSLEFKLLKYFLENRGRVATRDSLLDRVWGYDAEITTRTVDTHIKRLREKLGSAGNYIETIRGVGYRFKEIPS